MVERVRPGYLAHRSTVPAGSRSTGSRRPCSAGPLAGPGHHRLDCAVALPNPERPGSPSLMSYDRSDLDDLFDAAYDELRRLASQVGAGDPSATLNPTALVNEAYLRLSASPRFSAQSDLHFRRIAARVMRRVLVEAARRRGAAKRGGGQPLVTFDDALDAATATSRQVLELDEALERLGSIEPRQAQVVELRFFGGLELDEAAAMLGVSSSTVSREWRAARAWLAHELLTS